MVEVAVYVHNRGRLEADEWLWLLENTLSCWLLVTHSITSQLRPPLELLKAVSTYSQPVLSCVCVEKYIHTVQPVSRLSVCTYLL